MILHLCCQTENVFSSYGGVGYDYGGAPPSGGYGYGGAPPSGDATKRSELPELEYSSDDEWEFTTDDGGSDVYSLWEVTTDDVDELAAITNKAELLDHTT